MVCDYLRRLWTTVRLCEQLALAWIKSTFRARFGSPAPEWTLQSAHAVCDASADFLDVTPFFDAASWEEDVHRVSGWDRFRVDVRYHHTSRYGKISKYRMVLRNGDDCPFPPPPLKRGVGGPRGVLMAKLIPHDVSGDHSTGLSGDHSTGLSGDHSTGLSGDHSTDLSGDHSTDLSGDPSVNQDLASPPAREVDVTGRLLKYAGPDKDFHAGVGLRVRVLDCFPFDNTDMLRARFACLHVTDAATFKTHEFSLKDDPELAFA